MWFQKHWVAIAGPIPTALYVYLQLLQWKAHGDDLMLTAASIVVTCALWIMLAIAIGRYWKDAKHSESLQAQIVTLKDEQKTQLEALTKQHVGGKPESRTQPSKLTILSAKYGNPKDGYHDRREQVERAVSGDSLSLLIGRETLGDPMEGKWKQLVVEYSYDGGPPLKTIRPESMRLRLPEDPWLIAEIKRLKEQPKAPVEMAAISRGRQASPCL